MKSFNEQINPDFLIQAKKLYKITQLLHNILPIECRNHVQVANIRNQNLMLITDSPVWTTRLRQLSPQILQYLKENIPSNEKAQIIHHVQISTRYFSANNDTLETAKKNIHKLEISEKTANLLSQSANSINHQQLKTALLKIARHANQHTAKSTSNKPDKTEK